MEETEVEISKWTVKHSDQIDKEFKKKPKITEIFSPTSPCHPALQETDTVKINHSISDDAIDPRLLEIVNAKFKLLHIRKSKSLDEKNSKSLQIPQEKVTNFVLSPSSKLNADSEEKWKRRKGIWSMSEEELRQAEREKKRAKKKKKKEMATMTEEEKKKYRRERRKKKMEMMTEEEREDYLEERRKRKELRKLTKERSQDNIEIFNKACEKYQEDDDERPQHMTSMLFEEQERIIRWQRERDQVLMDDINDVCAECELHRKKLVEPPPAYPLSKSSSSDTSSTSSFEEVNMTLPSYEEAMKKQVKID